MVIAPRLQPAPARCLQPRTRPMRPTSSSTSLQPAVLSMHNGKTRLEEHALAVACAPGGGVWDCTPGSRHHAQPILAGSRPARRRTHLLPKTPLTPLCNACRGDHFQHLLCQRRSGKPSLLFLDLVISLGRRNEVAFPRNNDRVITGSKRAVQPFGSRSDIVKPLISFLDALLPFPVP